jgi:hypothetical protein
MFKAAQHFSQFVIGKGGLADNLDGNGTFDVGVEAFVDDAHGASTQDIPNGVFADALWEVFASHGLNIEGRAVKLARIFT